VQLNGDDVMSISAQQVKELRERTGLGMMECKAALAETHGDMEAATDLLRKRAGAKVEKKSGRIAAEGAIGIFVTPDRKTAAMVEVNCETDFVAKGDDFAAFATSAAARVAGKQPATVDALYQRVHGWRRRPSASRAKACDEPARTSTSAASSACMISSAPSGAISTAARSACWWK
jgi:translation elongation factor EF-Ts